MKTFILGLMMMLAKFADAQDSLAKKDTEGLGFLISSHFRLDKNEVKKINAELFFVLIYIKDSVFSNLEVFSKTSSVLAGRIQEGLPKILEGFKCVSGKEKTIIFPMLILNSQNYSDRYNFIKGLKDYDNATSLYSSGIQILIGTGPDIR
jgi:hypothetical protein